jgi:hypothetical protein
MLFRIREALVADFEGGEFAGGAADVAPLVADGRIKAPMPRN